MQQRVGGLVTPDNAMRNAAREAIGLAQYKAGDLDAALQTFQDVAADERVNRDLQSRMQVYIATLISQGAMTAAMAAAQPAPAPPTEIPGNAPAEVPATAPGRDAAGDAAGSARHAGSGRDARPTSPRPREVPATPAPAEVPATPAPAETPATPAPQTPRRRPAAPAN